MSFLKQIGTVLHLSKSSGNLILKAESKIKISDSVFDKMGKNVGTVFDLFGPVAAPFLAVKPMIDDPERLLGKALFVEEKKGRFTKK